MRGSRPQFRPHQHLLIPSDHPSSLFRQRRMIGSDGVEQLELGRQHPDPVSLSARHAAEFHSRKGMGSKVYAGAGVVERHGGDGGAGREDSQ